MSVFQEHYPPLVIAYLIGLGGWLAFSGIWRQVWPHEPAEGFVRPWKEFGIALVGAIGILAVGQLWSRGIRLPEHGAFGPASRRDQPSPDLRTDSPRGGDSSAVVGYGMAPAPPDRVATACGPRPGDPRRHGIFTLTSGCPTRRGSCWAESGAMRTFDKMVQVFLEDLTIAILFVRLAGAIGSRWATVVVACLFALGHVPVMVSQGATWSELGGLLRDAGLGVAVIVVLQRSRDVAWFWCIHFCLDMTQFAKVSGVG